MSRSMHATTGGQNAQDLQKMQTPTFVVDIAVIVLGGFRVCAAT